MIPALPKIGKSLSELTSLVAGKLNGDENYVIEGAAGLVEAGPSDISFLGNMKYTALAEGTKAGCVLMPNSSAQTPCGAKNRIFVDDPQYAFSQVLGLIEAQRPKLPPMLDSKAAIHFQARLGPGVSVGAFTVIERAAGIGENTFIGPQCYIGENVRIGRHCLLHPRVTIHENSVIGDRVVIHSGAVIGADGFGFSTDRKTGKHRKIPQVGNVVLKDDVDIGANTTVDRATVGSTVIEAGTKIDNLVQIGHNCRVGKDCLLVSQAGVAGSTSLGDRVILAGQAGLAGHIHIGDGAVIMAQTGVMSDVEKGKVMFGYPAKPHREAFKLQVLYAKLPEIYEAVKEIKQKLDLPGAAPARDA